MDNYYVDMIARLGMYVDCMSKPTCVSTSKHLIAPIFWRGYVERVSILSYRVGTSCQGFPAMLYNGTPCP